jgi:hypothetical protein
MSAEEKWQVLETLAAYSQLVADRAYEEWSELFVEDGQFITPRGVMGTGRAELAAYVRRNQREWGPFKQVTVNAIIDVQGTTATASSDWMVIRKVEGQLVIYRMGRYQDSLRRDLDRWRFVIRRVAYAGDLAPARADG